MSESKWVWIPDRSKLFVKAELLSEGEIAKVKGADGQIQEIPLASVDKVNPTQFDRANDIGELTYLNEPSVIHNLSERYAHDEIYTYSGLFLVAVNPYKPLGIYSSESLEAYRNKQRDEVPPHIYAVAEAAYRQLLTSKHNQSILITGESGAGKTENTKRAIQYLSSVTANSSSSSKDNKGTLGVDAKILQTNPILEAFGNAQTVRNNNSSRFGKFIRIEFNNDGAISGASIEWYLLEKSRVITQTSAERNYHVFYQLLAGAPEDLRKTLLLEKNAAPADFAYLRNSAASISGVSDSQEFNNLLEALKAVGLSQTEINAAFTIVAAVLHLGNIEIKNESAEQGRFSNATQVANACKLLGVSADLFSKAVLKPKIQAGREQVTQARSATQARFALDALAKALYERLFGHVVGLLNTKLRGAADARSSFIGVLDIAGFEIFENNSFEQLCINYTNERLQQFFNHHMFVLEQEEYVNQKIDWDYVDYGADLQPTIDLIEKTNPMGIFSYLDEDSVMPRATDKTFTDKVNDHWKDKTPQFKPSRMSQGFVVSHYAAPVEYNTEGWLDKNKDPLSEPVVELLQASSNTLVKSLFQPEAASAAPASTSSSTLVSKAAVGRRRGKFRTVAQRHKEQLSTLMATLEGTNPHFVRCIIPNKHKQAGEFSNELVLEQLRCNGVLEGIRIARSGYPNRLEFSEFRSRYQPLVDRPQRFEYMDGHRASSLILKDLNLDPDLYKVGLTKVFFRNGVLAELEERRDAVIKEQITVVQAIARAQLVRRSVGQELFRRQAAQTIAAAAKTWSRQRSEPWWQLLTSMRPLLASADSLESNRKDVRMQKLEDKLKDMRAQFAKQDKDHSARAAALVAEKDQLTTEMSQMETKLEKAQHKQSLLSERLKKGAALISQLNERPEIEVHEAALVKARELEAQHSQLAEAHTKAQQSNKDLLSQQAKASEDHTAELAAVRAENADLHKQLAEARRSANDANKSSDAAHKASEEAQAAAAAANAELSQLKTAHREQVRQLSQEHEQKLAEHGKKNEAAEASVSAASLAAASLKKELAELKDRLTLRESELSSHKNDLAKAQDRFSRTSRDLESTRSQLEDSTKEFAKVDAQSKELQSLRKEFSSMQRDYTQTAQKLETALVERDSISKELAALRQAPPAPTADPKEVEQLKRAIEQARKQAQLDLHTQEIELQALRERVAKADEAQSNSKKLVESLRQELEGARASVGVESAMAAQRERERQGRRSLKVDDLEQNVADLDQQRHEAISRAAKFEAEVQSLRREIASTAGLKQRLEKVQREKAQALEERSRLMFGMKDQQQTAHQLELEKAKGTEAKRLMSEIKVLKLQLCKSERERKVAEARNPDAQLLAERNHAVRQSLDLQSQVKAIEIEKVQLQQRLELTANSRNERRQSLQLHRELNEARSEVDSLKAAAQKSALVIPKTRSRQDIPRALRVMSGNQLEAANRSPGKMALSGAISGPTADLEIHLETEMKRNAELSESLEVYRKRAEEFHTKLEDVEVVLRQAKVAENSARQQVEDMRRRQERLKAEHEMELATTLRSLERVRAELDEKEASGAADLVSAGGASDKQLDALRLAVNELTSERDRLQGDKTRLERRIAEFGGLNVGDAAIQRAHEQVLSAQRDHKAQLRVAEDLRQQVQHKERQVDKLKSDLAESDAAAEAYREQIDMLQQESAKTEASFRRSQREAADGRERALRLERDLEMYRTRMQLSRQGSRLSQDPSSGNQSSGSGFVFV